MKRLERLSCESSLSLVIGLAIVVAVLSWFAASHVTHGASRLEARTGATSERAPSPQGTLNSALPGEPRAALPAAVPPPAGPSAASRVQPNAEVLSALARHRAAILSGPYGTAPIEDVLRALVEVPGGPEVQLILQALALRKAEALPLVKARLRTGELWEKVMLTKFLAHCPWPETRPDLVALMRSETEPWLARQGAVSALGALGDATAGPGLVALLREPGAPVGLQLAAIAAIVRINDRDVIPALRPFLQHGDIHLRLFAIRALAELGEAIVPELLRPALGSEDYVVRLEACEAAGALSEPDLLEPLQDTARNDAHEAVRNAAAQALLMREVRGKTPAEKLSALQRALENAGRPTALWIVRTMLQEGGLEGRALVEALGAKETWLGERCRAHLILAAGK